MLGTKKNEEIPGTPWFSREKPTDFPYSLRKLSSSPLPQITSNVLCGAGTEQIGEKKTCRETVSQITEKINRQWPRYDRRRFLAIASRIPSTFFFLLFFFFFFIESFVIIRELINWINMKESDTQSKRNWPAFRGWNELIKRSTMKKNIQPRGSSK